jgi:hypothetical protein
MRNPATHRHRRGDDGATGADRIQGHAPSYVDRAGSVQRGAHSGKRDADHDAGKRTRFRAAPNLSSLSDVSLAAVHPPDRTDGVSIHATPPARGIALAQGDPTEKLTEKPTDQPTNQPGRRRSR